MKSRPAAAPLAYIWTVVKTRLSSAWKCALPDGTEYLVYFMRHPLSPYYCIVGEAKPGTELANIQAAATDLLVDNSLPNVLVQWNNPEATAADVPDMLRDRVIEVATWSDADLTANAAWIAETMGRTWEFATADPSEGSQFRAKVRDETAGHPKPDRGFNAWWTQASIFDNLMANFRELPDAWDGALKTQKGFRNLRLFDVGPLVVTYSTIGMPDTEMCSPQPDDDIP